MNNYQINTIDYDSLINNIWKNYLISKVNHKLNTDDKENLNLTIEQKNSYFSIGFDAVRIIKNSLLSAKKNIPKTILDFPSGSGRVTRHLRALFPESLISVCDLYESHIKFCQSEFNAIPILSDVNFDKLNIGKFDLIFCGSLLTHLPKESFFKVISFIKRSLSDIGVAIITLEGRHTLYIQNFKWKLCSDNIFNIAKNNYFKFGFGFANYANSIKAVFDKNENYGVALTNPIFVFKQLINDDSVRILNYTERCWNDHQDVLVFGKPGINK